MTTDELVLDRSLGRAIPEDYIAWAVDRLAQGDDTPSLRILAGLHPMDDRDEVESYFQKSWHQLGLAASDLTPGPREAYRVVRRLFDNGILAAVEAVERMAGLYRLSEYQDPLLAVWYAIEEELLLQGRGPEGVFYPVDSLEPLEEAIRREWRLLDAAIGLDLPEAYDRFVRCDACSHIGRPALKRRSSWQALRAALPWVRTESPWWPACSKCGSFEHRSMSDPDVREDYFARLASTGADAGPRAGEDTSDVPGGGAG